MTDLILHPSVVAIPTQRNLDVAEKYVARIINWSIDWSADRTLLVSFGLMDYLTARDRFPYREQLDRYLRECAAIHVDARDVSQVVMQLFNRANIWVEARTRVEEMATGPGGPTISWSPTPSGSDSLDDVVCMESWLKAIVGGTHGHSSLSLYGIAVAADSSGDSGDFQCDSVVTSIRCDCNCGNSQVNSSGRWYGGPEAAIAELPVEIRRSDPILAVRAALYRRRIAGEPDLKFARQWSVYEDLAPSLGRLNSGDFELATRMMTRVACTPPAEPQLGHDHHSGNNQVRVRSDGAKARRIPLTTHQEGWRLLLWMLPDGGVQFASVNSHNDYHISEC